MNYSKPAHTGSVGTVGTSAPARAPLPHAAPLPWVRTLAFAIVSVAFAVGAHTSAEHRLPSWWLGVVAVPIVTMALRPLAAAERGSGSLLAGLIALQLGLHAVFVTATGSRGGGGAAGWLCCGTSSDGNQVTGLTTSPQPHAAGGLLSLSRAAVVQLTIHLLAAVVLAWAMRCQERALWIGFRQASVTAARLLLATVTALGTALIALPVTRRPARRTPRDNVTPTVAIGLLVVARRARRGPPALAFRTA